MIPGGFARFLARNGVVFLRKVRWISFRFSGDGVTPESLKMRVLLGKRYNPAKPLLFGKSGYYPAKDILCGKSMGQAFFSYPKACSYYGRFTLNVVN